jgi:hypothetical protein
VTIFHDPLYDDPEEDGADGHPIEHTIWALALEAGAIVGILILWAVIAYVRRHG